ncbi:MAG: hypothetical protein Kow00127_14160 [Bacteroidales bacterium]
MKRFNKEIKARCTNPEQAAETLRRLGAVFHGTDNQTDTYFNVPEGRLKLREGNIEQALIFYRRPEKDGYKSSDVTLYKSGDTEALKNILTEALGVKKIVEKKRDIWFLGHVKFHIDELTNLGSFIEIEVIDESGRADQKEMEEQLLHLMEVLKIIKTDLVTGSYLELT